MQAFADAGEIVGRKKLQKMIYIAKKMQFTFNEKYNFHFYGPYSEELTLRVEELYNLGYISERKEKKGGYFQYHYSLTDEGEQFLADYEVDMPSFKQFMKKMNEQSSRFLELVSTILYFDNVSKAEVKEKVFTLKRKQRYTEEEIEQAYQYIDSLKKQIEIN